MIVTVRKDRTLKNITIKLKKTRLLIPLVHELWPHHGMGFTYTVDPPTSLGLTRTRFSGILKYFSSDGTVITINVSAGNTPVDSFKVFVSVPGGKRDKVYYRKVESYLQKNLCEAIEKKPAEFEAIVRSLIE